jgi:hypothetical protein
MSASSSHRLTRLVTLVGLAFAVALICTAPVVAATLTCSSLYIDPAGLPLGYYSLASIGVGDSIGFAAGEDPVVDVRIVPPRDLANPYICDEGSGGDYLVDLTDGNASLTFRRLGPYYVQVTRANSAAESLTVGVGVKPMVPGPPFVDRPPEPYPPQPNGFLLSDDPDLVITSGLDFEGPFGMRLRVNSIAEARQAILDEYVDRGSKPIEVYLMVHGRSASLKFKNDRLTPDNIGDLTDGLKGKLKSLHLFACSVAADQDGKDFVTDLSCRTGVVVGGATGTVWVPTDPTPDWRIYWIQGELYVNDATPAPRTTWGALKAKYH